ncbi:MAG: adenosylcobinamide-GDP ribazoletransferase [Desulfobacteraceae bacterium]|nr:adenosylcobinamide-GDP ribazoletransferase [Desulfobacteraceae bacterium]
MENKNNILSDLRSSLSFLTILPMGKDVVYSPMGMIRFFPVVGLIVGLFLVICNWLFSKFWPAPVVAILDVLVLAIVTGAFHIDGLGDTADGIFSHRSRQRALEIMKDSRTGMMGLVAVVSLLAVKTAGIFALIKSAAPFEVATLLLIIPSYARASMLFGFKYLKYGRIETGGTGLDLFKDPVTLKDFLWIAVPCAVSLFLGFKCLLLNMVFGATVFWILIFYKRKMNCITGDMLGAMTEVTEAVLFLCAGASLL